ncbi:alkaline phosphatase PafA [Mesonia aquimarina]|uniref:alkaline phosphatase PafA n=1 Tax=Mesonia aquimarina TaxID=1504967 RepID=UPI000EF62A10|nr:alkaline phosphatase PafA [Mesonia aquimarina]
MKKLIFLVSVLFVFSQCKTPVAVEKKQENKIQDSLIVVAKKPKLVVGIVVDQMRYDYLTRFWDNFGDDGFKRLVEEGFTCRNNHFNYVPTYTGPGHASVYSGTTPVGHGIISNTWFDKKINKSVYCTEDNSVKSIGIANEAGQMSPKRMMTTSIADQNRLHTQFKGKTIGVALKDRGAILPAGHTANAAYWFYGKDQGKFISSSFYQKELPVWVQQFNASEKADSYLKNWNTLNPIERYTESGQDVSRYEFGFIGEETPSFPYDLKKLSNENSGFDILKTTPFGNNLTTDFALTALEEENLGADDFTDFLCISYSSTDYIGHNFGVNSKEVQDAYIRLDQDISRLLSTLDKKVGKGNYTLFLTSDHGAVQVPSFLADQKIPAGYFDVEAFQKAVTSFLGKEYGVTDLVKNISNNQVFFDYERLAEENINRTDLEKNLAHFILNFSHVSKTITRSALKESEFSTGTFSLIQKGFHQKRSGDVVFMLDPGYIIYPEKGSTHGSALNYDTHAPLLFFGNGIEQGETYQKTEITDIAPTISALLGIAFPNGATGNVLPFVFKKD